MKQSTIVIKENSSERVDFANLIVSVRTTYGRKSEIVVGCPGLPNLTDEMQVGDAVLF